MTRKNSRTLDEIADKVHGLQRANIIEIGDLLLEARDGCDSGKWLAWLEDEFEWSQDTAANYMKVSRLCSRFRNFRNLKLGATTLYQLADHEPEEELPEIIAELAKHATEKRLRPRDAERVIKIGIGRRRHGDHPDATLAALVDVYERGGDESLRQKMTAELLRLEPDNDEAAAAIIDEISQADEHGEDDSDEEVENVLTGPPPPIPPPTPSSEPQKLGTETPWPETEVFTRAITDLLALRGKPLARLIGKLSATELKQAADFLNDVVRAADKAKSKLLEERA